MNTLNRFLYVSLGLVVSMVMSISAYAASVEITFDPVRPVVNESFNIIFNVATGQANQKEPYISFELSRGEVKSKKLAGTTTNATVINGRFQLSKSYRYEYEVIADRSGTLTLKNIEVDVDGEIVKPGNKTVKVFSKRQQPASFFLQAEVDRSTAYIGEGIDLRYYLYTRTPVSPLEIEIFPKLKGFIKRFHMPDNSSETVEVDGVIYRRTIQYSARLYPEKVGKLRIDPLKLKVQYSDTRRNGMGSFGFAFGRRRNKSLRSKPIVVNVENVPATNVPSNFTGLVGEHNFKFEINKTKFLVNEVLEMKLVVEGPGALENMDVPQLINHPQIEKFDIKGELQEIGKSRASKTFEFTYLPRGNVEIPEKKVDFYYYDRNKASFESKSIIIPAITVKGGGQLNTNTSNDNQGQTNTNTDYNSNQPKALPEIDMKLLAPDFTEKDEPQFLGNIRIAIIVLVLAIIGLAISMMKGIKLFRKYPAGVKEAFQAILNTGLNFGTISRFIREVAVDQPVHKPLKEQIQALNISDDAKSYFTQCVAQSEVKNYGRNRKKNKIKIERKYFKEALKQVEL
jgi:hypothetical protein